MELVRCRHSQVRHLSMPSKKDHAHLTCTSIVEANASIKVACMPACASCFRYLHSSLKTYINTRASHTKTSNKTSTTRDPKVVENLHKPEQNLKPRYWRFRDRRGRDEGPPQITSVTGQSSQGHCFGDLSTTDTKSFHEAGIPTSMESSSSLDGEQRLPEPDDIV